MNKIITCTFSIDGRVAPQRCNLFYEGDQPYIEIAKNADGDAIKYDLEASEIRKDVVRGEEHLSYKKQIQVTTR